MKTKYFISIFILIQLHTFCFSQVPTELPNIAPFYNPSLSTLHPVYKLFHKSDHISTIYSFHNISELNFKKVNNEYKAMIKIKYMFYESLENKNILDSASKIVVFIKDKVKEQVVTYFDVSAPPTKCKLVIITKDLYNQQQSIDIIDFDNSSNSHQNFLLLDADTYSPVFYNFIHPNNPYKIKYSKLTDSLLVTRYVLDSTAAKNPAYTSSISNPLISDSIFYIKGLEEFSVRIAGLYSIIDKKNNCSLSFICSDKYFPEVKTANQMIPPLRYLCSSKKYKLLEEAVNKKIAVDTFWLAINNDTKTAKSLLRVFYNRVLYSNLKFTDTKEGWKTDRGMIYIIFGPPKILYKGDNFEKWGYVNIFTGTKLYFEFNRHNNDISNNIFLLNRNNYYAKYWRNAIENWNKGNLQTF